MHYMSSILLLSALFTAPTQRQIDEMQRRLDRQYQREVEKSIQDPQLREKYRNEQKALREKTQQNPNTTQRYRPNPVTGGFDTYDNTGRRTNQYRPDLNRGYRVYDQQQKYQGTIRRGMGPGTTAPKARSNNYLRPGNPYAKPYRRW